MKLYFSAESTQLPATSCERMACYFGAHCVMRSGLAACECAGGACPAPAPPAPAAPSVCGSDGRTYLSACHLRTHACRTQSDIVAQAFGPCGDDAPHVRRGSRSIGKVTFTRIRTPSESNSLAPKHEQPGSVKSPSVDTSDSGKPDSPEPELTCVDILPPLGYR